MEQRSVKPEEALADPLYGGDENHEAAKAKDVDLIAPTLDKQRNLFCILTDISGCGE